MAITHNSSTLLGVLDTSHAPKSLNFLIPMLYLYRNRCSVTTCGQQFAPNISSRFPLPRSKKLMHGKIPQLYPTLLNDANPKRVHEFTPQLYQVSAFLSIAAVYGIPMVHSNISSLPNASSTRCRDPLRSNHWMNCSKDDLSRSSQTSLFFAVVQ